MKKDITNWLLSGNLVDDNDRIIIDEDSFARTITGHKNSRPLLGFITLILAILMCIFLIIRYTVSYFEDNLLYESKTVSTTEGALIIHQSLGRDYVLYMFNTAEPWANTGITLYKGDRLNNIGISGGFHSSVGHLISDTEKNNSMPSVRLRSFNKAAGKNSQNDEESKEKEKFLVYPDEVIGNALYRVGNTGPKSLMKRQKKWEDIKINKDGILYLSINDLNGNQLDSFANNIHIHERFVKDYKDDKKNLYFPEEFEVRNKLDSTEIQKIKKAYEKRFIDIRDFFYADNIGQVMFCAEIIHPLPWFSEKNAFRYIDSKLRQCSSTYINLKAIWGIFVFMLWMTGLIALHLLIILIPMALIYMITQHPRYFYHRRKRSAMLSVLLLLLFPSVLNAQEYVPYLSLEEVPTSVVILPEPPAAGSDRFNLDSCTFVSAKALRNTDRGMQAVIDANVGGENILSLFSEAFGIPITVESMPMLSELLLRSKETFGDYASREAKHHYMRERPFMYFNEPSGIPDNDSWLITNGSYPSGHSAIYTGISLILAEINPDRQDEILLRGQDGAFSRVIVGAHWYSDIEAGKVVASAAYARLHSDKAFNKQLKKAKREFCRAKKKQSRNKTAKSYSD